MTQPLPTVLTWDDEGDPRFSQMHRANAAGDPTDNANAASALIATQPVGKRAIAFQNITTAHGLSFVEDWPQWCIDKLDPAEKYLSSAITWMTTYWARINTLGVLPDYVVLDEENPLTTFNLFPSTGATAETVPVTAASFSSGEATYTVGSHNGAVPNTIAVDGITPGGYNGLFAIKSTTPTTITVDMTTDPGGVGTVFGFIYLGLNTRERMYQMILDDASALANIPTLRIQNQVSAADFRSLAVDSSEKNAYNPWAHTISGAQLKTCVADIVTAQTGTTPVFTNFSSDSFHMDDPITGVGGQAIHRGGLLGTSAQRMYLDGSDGGKYSGSDKDKQYQNTIDVINTLSSNIRSGATEPIPWVSYVTGAPNFQLYAMVVKAAWELGVRKFHLFNPSAGGTNTTGSLFFDVLPAITPQRPVIDFFDATTMPTVEVGSVTFDRQEMENIL